MHLPKGPIQTWKIVGACVGIFVIIGIAILFWTKSIEARRWSQMQTRMDELRGAGWGQCEARSRIPRGQPVAGEAWLDYSSALTSARMTPDEEKVVRAFVITSNASAADVVREALGAHIKALDLLASGVRKERIGAWGTPPPPPIQSGSSSQYSHLSFLCVAQSRLWMAEGNSRQAAEPLLDFVRMMLDFVDQNPTRQGVAWIELAIPLHDLKLLAASAPMTPDELTSLGSELAKLDEGFPCYVSRLPQDLLYLGKSLQDSNATFESLTGDKEGSFVSARYAWSSRLMKADAFFTLDAAARKVLQLHEGDYESLRRAYDDIWAAGEVSRNPIVRRFRLVNRWGDAAARERHTQIRLARAAAKYRECGDALNLADPWGTVLQHKVGEGTMTFWSIQSADTHTNPRPGGWKTSYDPSYLSVEVRR